MKIIKTKTWTEQERYDFIRAWMKILRHDSDFDFAISTAAWFAPWCIQEDEIEVSDAANSMEDYAKEYNDWLNANILKPVLNHD